MNVTILIICGIITAYWGVLTALSMLAQKQIGWLSLSSQTSQHTKKISAIIPARNEEEDLAASLRSVLNQKGVELEVIVVNDHSTDRTGEIANAIAQSDSRVQVIHNPPLPPGWLGKCNAMQQGAARATSEYLLFSDADIFHAQGCFTTALSVMERKRYDLLSLFPLMDIRPFWENVILPIYLTGLAKLIATPGIEDPNLPNAVATGAFMLIKTSVFQAIGGFEAIKSKMLDDVALARQIKAHQYHLGYRLAPECLSVRLFKTNQDAFWGTTKNILVAIDAHIWLLALPLAIMAVMLLWMPLFTVAYGVFSHKGLFILLGLVIYGMQYFSFFVVRRLLHFRPLKLLFFPLAVIVVISSLSRALFYHAKGAIFWRGRAVRVRD